MALASYADLTAAARDWLARDAVTLPDARLADCLALAEADIYDRLRVPLMERSAPLAVSGQTVALPDDFLEARYVLLPAGTGGSVEIAPTSPSSFWGRFPTVVTGRPAAFAIEGDALVLGPAPDAAYALRLLYYARPASVADGNTALLARYPDLFLNALLVQAAIYVQDDERLSLWAANYAAAMERANTAGQRQRYGSSPLRMRAG